MADGTELLLPYQYGFRDLLFGSNTDFRTTEVEGLLDMPSVDAGDTDKDNEHGAFPGILVMRKRVLQFDMTIVGAAGTDIEGKLDTARRVFQVPRKRYSRDLEWFTFWRPGNVKKFCFVRCTKRNFPSNFKTARGLAEGSVELTSPDTKIYSTTLYSNVVPSGTGTGSNTITMNGDYVDGAWPFLTITGPVTTALIQNTQDDGRTIRLNLNLTAGQVATVDVEKEIVRIDGVRASSTIRSDNQWWALLPGANQITYTRQGGTASSTVTVEHRDTWQ